jgi:predicted amidohydrolase
MTLNKSSRPLRVAVAQYQPSAHEHWAAYVGKLDSWVAEAAHNGAQLLLFPEYDSMELAALLPAGLSVTEQFAGLQQYAMAWRDIHQQLASRYRVAIVAGSFPLAPDEQTYVEQTYVEQTYVEQSYVNRAWFCQADGSLTYQDKRLFVQYEAQLGCLQSGQTSDIIETSFGTLAICVCYDSEFPLIVRNLVEQGAWLILVPSCTETLAGYHRVRIGCQARALENQCFVAQAVLVGAAPWSDLINISVGAAGVYAPPDKGMPPDGVVSKGELNQPGWIYADLDAALLHKVREQGHVHNYRDWNLQSMTPPFGK